MHFPVSGDGKDDGAEVEVAVEVVPVEIIRPPAYRRPTFVNSVGKIHHLTLRALVVHAEVRWVPPSRVYVQVCIQRGIFGHPSHTVWR